MPPARLASLDVLRFAAIALVLGRHSIFLANWEMGRLPPNWRAVLEPWYIAGWVGVDLFFVLSGFLVAGLLFRDYRETGRLAVGLVASYAVERPCLWLRDRWFPSHSGRP